ncbi:MAG: RluA family pseudouridine synthase [Microthrixaceae bacterium]
MSEPPPGTVPPALAGERLDRYIALVFDCSRSEAVGSVHSGAVEVDGLVVTKPATRLEVGQVVVLTEAPDRQVPPVLGDPDVGFEVIHEDTDLVVLDKPVGLVVHPGAGNPDGTLCNGLVHRYPEMSEVGEPQRPGIVHRLDRATSGLMVAARSQRAYESLVDQLATHRVQRTYRTVVLGHPEADRGVIDAPIGRSRRNPLRMTVAQGARPARTRFEVLERMDDPTSALVTCELETGRTHQIRVHMRSVGHPVLGDDIYGDRRGDAGLGRMFLHAIELGFDHPATGEPLDYASPLPSELAGWLGSHLG